MTEYSRIVEQERSPHIRRAARRASPGIVIAVAYYAGARLRRGTRIRQLLGVLCKRVLRKPGSPSASRASATRPGLVAMLSTGSWRWLKINCAVAGTVADPVRSQVTPCQDADRLCNAIARARPATQADRPPWSRCADEDHEALC